MSKGRWESSLSLGRIGAARNRKIYKYNYNYNYKMKTIAVSEKTFELLRSIKETEKGTFDKVIYDLVISEKKIPKSMFGAFKAKGKPFTDKERNDMWRDRI